MEDLQKIKEFFSNPLEEISKEDAWKEFQEKRHVTDKTAAAAKKDFDKGWEAGKYRDGNYKLEEEEVNVSNDIPDIIAVDVPLFIRLLEFAREDAGDDMDLHEVAERAIEAVKMRGVLSMDDYETLIPPKEELDEKMLVPKDKIDRMARDIASKFFTSKADKGEAIEILKQAVRDVYKNLDPEAEIQEAKKLTYNDFVRMVRDDMMAGAAPDERPSEELVGKRAKAYYNEYLQGASLDDIFEETGYSKYLATPENPKGETPGLTPDVMSKILMKIMQDVEETKQLGENLNEELCPKGKAYIKKRMAAGEKSSAYLSGRAVKVCKGQMKG